MRRSWLLWTIFGLCLAVSLGALVWISATILRLERTQAEAQRQAEVEENVRLALWRMDSALSPLVSAETARPYFDYSAFTPAERAYTRMYNPIEFGEVLVPSPILVNDSPWIFLHFQFAPDGTLTSPQVPTGNMRDLASKHLPTREKIRAASQLLDEFSRIMKRDELASRLPANFPIDYRANFMEALSQNNGLNNSAFNGGNFLPQSSSSPQQRQAQRSIQELQARAKVNIDANQYEMMNQRADPLRLQNNRVREGVMQPLWIGGTLVLARRVSIDNAGYIQGLWLNWPEIRKSLLEKAADLLPSAQLQPVTTEQEAEVSPPRRLAALPVRLVAGSVPAEPAAGLSPIGIALVMAWVCVLIGMAAIGALLWGAMALSERRGAFVSAVTHELRTPLTTVSMYAEMLEGGMVPDECRRRQYLGTVRAEAQRLGHLIENVLAYSRIERGRGKSRIQEIALPQLIDGLKNRLAERAEQSGMKLDVAVAEDARDLPVRADASAVEQILFNLVDNAGKYAAGATDRRIHVDAQRNGSCALIRVKDHGPGIAPADARKLFRPFSKSAKDAANSAPGVGLGLALSRRLARQMKGDLRLEKRNGEGASFLLSLPVA